MSIIERFLEDYRLRQEILVRQIELLKSGTMRTGENHGGESWRDTTAQTLKENREDLAHIERLIGMAQAKLDPE